jgi:ATP-dependent RNA helicase DeaD
MDQTVHAERAGYTFFRGVESRYGFAPITSTLRSHVEQDQENAGTSGVSRSQNQLHLLPEDWDAAGALIEPLLERLEATSPTTQLLVVTNDSGSAVGIASRLTSALPGALRILAATEPRRAARVQRAALAHVLVGPPEVLVHLLQSTVLKFEGLRAVVLAWVDDLNGAATRALETLMSELPKESARLVLASAATPAVEQLVERYARRARRMQSAGSEPIPSVSLSFVTVGETARLATLRRILDAVDPESAIVIARDESRAGVESSLRSLGYGDDASTVRVARTPDANAQLVIVYDLPSSEEELRNLVRASGSARIIALVAPRQLGALRRLAGGTVVPFALPAAAERARTREEGMRDELREVLVSGQYARELLALEPLLAEHDGAEVAAAALRLLEAERAKPRSTPVEAGAPAMTRLFVNIGEMDSIRPADLVGAITNEAGISRSDLGRVDVREKHSTVEVSTAVANSVVAKLTGVTIKGRRALVKVDEERERRPGPPRDRSGRPPGRSGPGRGPGRDRPERDRPRRDSR